MTAPIRLDKVLQTMKGTAMPKQKEPQATIGDIIAAASEEEDHGMAPGEVPVDEDALDEADAKAESPAPAPGDAEGNVACSSCGSAHQPGAHVKREVVPAVPTTVGAPLPAKAFVGLGRFGVELKDLESLWRFSQMVFRSGLAPTSYKNPEAIAVAVQLGMEIGLPPMTAIQNVAVINGKPGVYGDIPLAVAQASGELEAFDEWFEHKGAKVAIFPAQPDDTTTAVCRITRKGFAPKTWSFSVADAKTAKLWMKTGRNGEPTPWVHFPSRMLMFRARQFNLRDTFPDKLKGVKTVDELRDQDAIDTDATDAGPIEMPKRASETGAEAEAPTPNA